MKNVRKKRMSIWKKALIITISVVLAIVLIVFGTIYFVMGRVNTEKADDFNLDITFEDEEIPEGYEVLADFEIEKADNLEIMSDSSVINILLVGVDSRDMQSDRGTRSDTMMIISINSSTKKVKMTSLLRDLYVDIPERGGDRLNHSHAYGGINLLKSTIEENFRVKIDHYAKVNFENFARIIDKLGGVSIDLTGAEAEVLGMTGAGTHTLNGVQATSYSRIRNIDSDFGRTGRQRAVMNAIIDKMKTQDVVTLTSLVYDLLPLVTTDYTPMELTGLVMKAPAISTYAVEQMHLPESDNYRGVYIRGMAVLVTDIPTAAQTLQNFIYK